MHQQFYKKSVIRHLEETNIWCYLTTRQQRKALEYPLANQSEDIVISNQSNTIYLQLIAIDCQMVQTAVGSEICQLFIMNSKEEILFDQWFRPKNKVIDYITHIKGLTQQKLYAKDLKELGQSCLKHIHKIINGKVIVGHDLANDLRVLPIQHNLFIDTVALFPHNLGPPFKSKLKSLALEHLHRPIQWSTHNPNQDAKAALDLTILHIKQGRGIIFDIQAKIPQAHYSIDDLLQQAELSRQRISGLFLRGSRALQLQVQQKDYVSDWDYFCVYQTTSIINGKLIKLYNTDITIYDSKTFTKLLVDNNDLPLVQLFYLPNQYQLINKLQLPELEVGLVRESLGLHLGKCERKIKRFRQELQGANMQWKILKTYHLQLRFLDYFMQIHQTKSIYDVKKSKAQWNQLRQLYRTSNFETAQIWVVKQIKKINEQVHKIHKSHRPLKNKQSRSLNATSNQTQISVSKSSFLKDQLYLLTKKYVNNYIPSSLNPLRLALIDQLFEHGLSRMQQHRIGYIRHKQYPNLIQFHYLQSANFQHQICRQSRAIIVDQTRNYQIVSLPYFKFFDYNDPKFSQLSKFDFSSCRAYQKYDGSIAVMYCYKGEWQIASSRVPDGCNDYCFGRPETTIEFKLQFWKIFYKLGYKVPLQSEADLTFIFELMSKDHIIVVRREESSLVLHGVTNRRTGEELNHKEYGVKYGWRCSQQMVNKITSIQQAVNYVQTLNPYKHQGLILCDKNNLRLKVKSVGYLRANWLSELNHTPLKNVRKYLLTQVILSGESEIFCSYCADWKPMVQEVWSKIDHLNKYCEKVYKGIQHLSKKEISECIAKEKQEFQPFIYALCADFNKWHNRLQFYLSPKRLHQYLQHIKCQ